MGHVLGLVAVINGFQPAWFDFDTGGYTAPLARWGYWLETGNRVSRLRVDPGNRWLEAGDVMSRAPSERITDITVGALMDLGYPAAWYGAGRTETGRAPGPVAAWTAWA
jgi:hypothetical protein